MQGHYCRVVCDYAILLLFWMDKNISVERIFFFCVLSTLHVHTEIVAEFASNFNADCNCYLNEWIAYNID